MELKPNLPESDDLRYRGNLFFQRLREERLATRAWWFYILGAFILLAFPLGVAISQTAYYFIVATYSPPLVTVPNYNPEDLQIMSSGIIEVQPNLYSAYVYLFNPNTDLSAWTLEYRLLVNSVSRGNLRTILGSSHVMAGESRYLVFPSISLENRPDSISLEFDEVRWTRRNPDYIVDLVLSRQSSGMTDDGKFFVEGEIRNQNSLIVKMVPVNIVVFGVDQEILAVNSTELFDLQPYESRYFRVFWPKGYERYGLIDVQIPVNLLDPGLILPEGQSPAPLR